MTRRTALLALVPILLFASPTTTGCSSKDDQPAEDPCRAVKIDRFKELIVVDDAVMDDARTRNTEAGPWSFRYAVEQLVPDGMTPSQFMMSWADVWAQSSRVGTTAVAARPLVQAKLICPWLKRSPDNECNTDCSECKTRELDLSKAPFRLLAISNRIDLRKLQTDGPGTGVAGEGRLVFGMMDGPADDRSSHPMGLTLIFEYELPGASAREWAQRWHALGAYTQYDDAFKNALEQVTAGFVRRGAKPEAPSGSAISQLRSNEREFDWQWELREFKLTNNGVVLAPLANTPPAALNGSEALRDYLVANRDAVIAEKHFLPPTFRGGVIQQGFKWSLPVDEPLRAGFAKQTCNGCHQTEAPFIDGNFHVSPFKKGIDKLSRHVHNPDDLANDNLGARTREMQDALCGN